MSKICVDRDDTIIDVLPSLTKKSKQFNYKIQSEGKYLYMPENIYGWSK